MASSKFHMRSIFFSSLAVSLAVSRLCPSESRTLGRMMLRAVCLFAAQLGLMAIYRAFIYPLYVSPLRHLPSPKGTWIPFRIIAKEYKPPTGAAFLEWIDQVPNNGLIRVLTLFEERLVPTTPAALRELLVTRSYDWEKGAIARELFKYLTGNGLTAAEGDSHKFLRKNLNPAFNFRRIKELNNVFWAKAFRLTDRVASRIQQGSNSVVEMESWAIKVTLDIVGVATTGEEFHAMEDKRNPLAEDYEELFKPTGQKLLYMILCELTSHRFVLLLPWKLNNLLQTKCKSMREDCARIVRQRREDMSQKDSNVPTSTLSMLIEGDALTDTQIVDQLLTFLPAGHETAAGAFLWALYHIATDRSVQTALRNEIIENVQLNETLPADYDLGALLESLPMLNAVCNETLRLYPSPSGARTSGRPTTLMGYQVPVGTTAIISPWAINRSRLYWGPRAEEFIPERWIDTDPKTGLLKSNSSGGADSNFSMLTFSQGPRNCIGQGFVRAELRCLVAVFVAKFNIAMADPNEKVVPFSLIGTRPKGGLRLRLEPL